MQPFVLQHRTMRHWVCPLDGAAYGLTTRYAEAVRWPSFAAALGAMTLLGDFAPLYQPVPALTVATP